MIDLNIAIAFVMGVGLGVVLLAILVSAKRSDPDDSPDTERLDFLTAHKMSLDCSPDGTTWGVLDGFPRDTSAIGLTSRQAIDKAMAKAVKP